MNNPFIKPVDFTAMLHTGLNRAWRQAYHDAVPCSRKPRKGGKRDYWATGPTGLEQWAGIKKL